MTQVCDHLPLTKLRIRRYVDEVTREEVTEGICRRCGQIARGTRISPTAAQWRRLLTSPERPIDY